MKRVLKTFLIAIAILVGLFILLITAVTIDAAIPKTDAFVIYDAALENPNYFEDTITLLENAEDWKERSRLRDTHFSFHIHRITSGNGFVVGYRHFDNESVWGLDDERFEKMTIWFPKYPKQDTTEYDLKGSNITAFFSRGGSAWPDGTTSGRIQTGTVRLVKHKNNYRVQLSGEVVPANLDRCYEGGCEPTQISFDFEADLITLDELNPWLGKAGDYPSYAETYR